MTKSFTFNSEDRHLLVISGELDECVAIARKLVANINAIELEDPKKANSYLGQECDAVIFHSHHIFDPNAFGAIAGTIRCGGYLLLLKSQDTAENSLFLTRFDRLLEASKSTVFINAKDASLSELQKPIAKIIGDQETNSTAHATVEQKQAVEEIIQVVKGHRRRPLVLSSDRGRGKSSALGITAAELINQGYEKIIVCAPSKKISAMVFQHATRINPDAVENNAISFYSPDDLQRNKPSADLVLVDEAAAIPVRILTDLLSHYSRIVFASTQHGYEGSGRGFSINFKKVLDTQTPDWNSFHLNTPIRWNENDSLEQFTFDALLLDAEPCDLPKNFDEKLDLADCEFSNINKAEMIADDNKLKAIFGLLVGAHYQTKPSDLMHLLDDDEVTLYSVTQNNLIIAVALIIREGEIDKTLSTDIFAGKRRIQGHLVAQSLSVNAGVESAIQLSGDRISRIAVHPELQGRGIGSYLLDKLLESSTADYVSTSFGATTQLLHFWQSSGFHSAYLGMKRDASSGSHSIVMLKPKSTDGIDLLNKAQNNFAQNFPHLLSDPLRDLEPDLAFAILSDLSNKLSHPPTLEAFSISQLHGFANDFRGYENTLALIWELTLRKLPKNNELTANEKHTLIIKVLQKNNWKELTQRMAGNISGKKDAIKLLRASVGKLLER
ncbi:GNAT family N-acetyltransferase [Cocleimonas flava]|uniref:tRNA(Met) cytidine acetyltransferase TmcA n=1 Tax=Cocleimonas flava TaxID=634765 RepID=A0A4V2P9G1_9GAMM|nr:GNAT family N-acetyltransferase [Cocleimonas flava]TCJ89315.1 tRNA(Met)-cytidine N(4)-acetyltransferase [Cocleimonas flava]